MKLPKSPPKVFELLAKLASTEAFEKIIALSQTEAARKQYLHWDKLRYYSPPSGFSQQEWWLAIKLSRSGQLVGLKDTHGRSFKFAVPGVVLEGLHQIDSGAGGLISIPEPITNPQTRDRYLISSLIEEAITSSQLEGAVTTRKVAKEMIRTGRKPRDSSERMIANNFAAMQHIREIKAHALTPDLVFQIHRTVTEGTLDDASAAGRLRRGDEHRVVADEYGTVFHDPPPADQLERRLQEMCDFANATTPAAFIHPAVRAILLHFWLAYDHPFVDGNGRTARALFYWAMLHRGYWLFEYISISKILRKAQVKYGRSFLYTETDDNDLTYFLVAQARVIRRAIIELHDYIARKTAEMRDVETHLRALNFFNHRQVEVIRHALKHPGQRYTVSSHQMSHNVAYQTARTDLPQLSEQKVLEQRKVGKEWVFFALPDMAERLKLFGKKVDD